MTPSAPDTDGAASADLPDGDRPRIARLVVEVEPFHLDRLFDYLVPDEMELRAGQRVQVAFSGRSVRALVVEVADASAVEPARLKPVRRVLGEHVWVRREELAVLRWAASRFGAPLADVVRHALPNRTVDVERRAADSGWFPPGTARRPASDPPPDGGQLDASWAPYGEAGKRLRAAVDDGAGSFLWRPLPGEDVGARLSELTQLCLAGDRDVLVLVPDPASPTADAVVRAAGDLAVDLRGGPSPRAVYRRWLEARCGVARVVVGERGAAFVPLDRLGLAVVLDEANPAFKERRSPRHHAREVVLERARRSGGVGLAVGTVPSAISWGLLRSRRLTPVVPSRTEERDARPRVLVVTGDDQPRARISRQAMRALRSATTAGAYGVVLAARRGEGTALVCGGCGQRLACPTCASSLSVPSRGHGVLCEGCGWGVGRVPACPECGERRVVPLAAGAARIGAELERAMRVPVAVLEGYGRTPPSPPAVLVSTRGSVLDAPPGRTDAVVLLDFDGMLRRPTLDAAEDSLRLAAALAGWCVHGRRDPAESQVVVQTRDPDHPAVRSLAAWDPGGFWRAEMELRQQLRFPPAAHALRLDTTPEAGAELAAEVGQLVPPGDDVLGPLEVEGRARLLIKCDDRAETLARLVERRAAWSRAGLEVRVDVDPVDAL